VQTLAGVKFAIGASFLALGNNDLFASFPRKIEGIDVNMTAAKLFFLHATNQGQGRRVSEGDRIGEYVVRYDDGSTQLIPIVFGEEMRDWWNNDRGQAVTRARVAWSGSNAALAASGFGIRLYISEWRNPCPQKTIASIDFVSAGTDAAPFCVAITAEEPAPAEASPSVTPGEKSASSARGP
jgi:hypothetical protein